MNKNHNEKQKLRIHKKAQSLHIDVPGAIVKLGDKHLLTFDDYNVLESSDDGATWDSRTLFAPDTGKKKYQIGKERAFFRCKSGTIILSFLNVGEQNFTWRDDLHDILPGCSLPHYTIRSTDNGKTWTDLHMLHDWWTGDSRDIIQTKSGRIDASSSPGLLSRLSSGRLLLIWNRYCPEGDTDFPLMGGKVLFSDVPFSCHREELSISFSEDDGRSWSEPVVIAGKRGGEFCYPRLLEYSPGELWIMTMQGELRIRLFENDFIGGA